MSKNLWVVEISVFVDTRPVGRTFYWTPYKTLTATTDSSRESARATRRRWIARNVRARVVRFVRAK
jgi:hypothetical protein